MTREEARKSLSETLMLLAEALLDDETCGIYEDSWKGGELKVTSITGNSTTVVAVKQWNYDKEDEWDDYIE